MTPPDDAASLSAVVEPGMRSTTTRARTMNLPDFTRGRWRTNQALDLVRV